MIKNYLKTAWRNLWKNKTFTFINILGLTIGLTSFLFIALYIFDELTFDRFHTQTENIYRVILNEKSEDGKTTKVAGAGYMVSEKGKADIPEIKNSVRIDGGNRANVSTIEKKEVFYEDIWMSNPGFLQTFDFKVLQGNRNTALDNPYSVVITEETAQKLFHTTNVLGKSILADDSIPFKITAVLKDFPANSHLAFNLVFSESTYADEDFKKDVLLDWNRASFTTYLLLSDKANVKQVENKLNKLVKANVKKDERAGNFYSLQPLKDIHFYSDDIKGGLAKTGNIKYIYVFSAVALFVLLIACINYMNLTTARFAGRSKEIAMRKVTGASRKNLIIQFLSESFLVTLIALSFALILVKVLLKYFNAFAEKKMSLGTETDYRIWLGIVLIVLVVGLLSGTYPAWFQSRLKPLILLKNNIKIGKSTISLRRALVVFQFVLSIIMIISTLVIYQQMQYVNAKDMGFRKDGLLVVDINSGDVRRNAQTIKNEFSRISGVKSVTVSSRVPGEWKNLRTVKARLAGKNGAVNDELFFIGMDERFAETYQIKFLRGRNFLSGTADSSSVIINETAAKLFGIKEPSEQLIEIPLRGDMTAQVRVVGIVKDFNFQSLHNPIAPILLGFEKNPVQSIDYFTLKVDGDNMAEKLKQMEAVLHRVDATHLFEYHFLDKQWQLFYREDKMRQTVFLITAMLTVFIACLGLFGLASYAAEQRIKEIGVRKVLGASVASITGLLSKDFLKLVVISFILASPIAWLFMHNWLQGFAYRIHISVWVFVVAGLAAVFIAFFTISFQAVKAALANPVKSLRSE